nr:zinc finger, CCHC-type, retrotransposon Gag domain protein [Tanacetum cinerariifolium]
MHLLGGKPISKPKVERLKREYHSIRQTDTETSTKFMQRFLRLAGSTLNHLMCIPFTDVAQVANAARNYEILHERDDDDAERPDKRLGVPLRATPTQSALRVDANTQESVVELLVPASSVVKLAICRRIARRT